ncbi:MAG TPA: PAS domain S-box protein [Patescibacteria group bacterium]|nr:PAS domain S-box protein [Patescibacteria group bacterium]
MSKNAEISCGYSVEIAGDPVSTSKQGQKPLEIEERRQAEQANWLLAAIVDSSEDAIISKDVRGIITSWNKSAERLFGYTAAEMIGKSILTLIPHDRQNEEPGILARIHRGERIEHFETVRQRKDGQLLDISLTISPIKDSRGRIIGASKIARDITERKRTEDELRTANQDLEQLAFIASHDLQEPLRNITTSAQLLMHEYSPVLDETAVKYMDSIVQGTARMRALLKDVLAFTELRSVEPIPAKKVELNAIFSEIRQNLAMQIKEAGAAITCDPLPVVIAQPSHFRSLFQNLIENAIKYRSDRPLKISVSSWQTEGELLLSFTDNGMGIDPAFHEKIFLPFKRLHGRKIPGTGVGLAICKRVVERYRGRIWVDSGEGRGATFYISLPREVLDESGSKKKPNTTN